MFVFIYLVSWLCRYNISIFSLLFSSTNEYQDHFIEIIYTELFVLLPNKTIYENCCGYLTVIVNKESLGLVLCNQINPVLFVYNSWEGTVKIYLLRT